MEKIMNIASSNTENKAENRNLVKAMELMAQHGIITISELTQIFNNKSLAREALEKLFSRGWIESYETDQGTMIWHLTDLGCEMLASVSETEPICIMCVDPKSCDTKRMLLGLKTRLLLEAHPLVTNWKTAGTIKREGGWWINGLDASFELAGTKIALSLELAFCRQRDKEFINKVKPILESFIDKNVLYITNTVSLVDSMRVRKQGEFPLYAYTGSYFILREDMLHNKLQTKIYSLTGKHTKLFKWGAEEELNPALKPAGTALTAN
ncbi:hypothetical protein ACFL6Y_09570 [Elusimicrobiota bacterium]